jgi:hypothetical protein
MARRRTPLDTRAVHAHLCSVDLRRRILSRVPVFPGLPAEAIADIKRLIC